MKEPKSQRGSIKKIGIFEVISFFTGFCLLSFELVAARLLAPTIGSSTYVWTGVIGVIIAALSLGFWTGGHLADRRNQKTDIVWLLLLSALFVTVTLLTYQDSLGLIAATSADTRLQAVAAALILFAPTSFFIGVTSPYLAKCRISSLASTARSIASLDAMNAVGGIVGTFLTGFILFGYVGSRQTLIVLTLLLLILSWLIVPRYKLWYRFAASGLLLVMLSTPTPAASAVIDLDTASAHYQIQSFLYNNRVVRGIATGPYGVQSGVYVNGTTNPVFWYTKELARITQKANPRSILILGGGTFTLPQYLATQLPQAHIDVVEIDPKLEQIAKDYFYYSAPHNVAPVVADARQYIQSTSKTYDVVIADVYNDAEIPFSLLTSEYGAAVSQRLTGNGIVLANIIGGTRGPCRALFDAANGAYLAKLRYGSYVRSPYAGDVRANIVALYSNTPARYGLTPVPAGATTYSDNFMPADRLSASCQAVSS